MFGFKHSEKIEKAACTHPHALPRWEEVADAGQTDKISHFFCPDCQAFLPAKQTAAS